MASASIILAGPETGPLQDLAAILERGGYEVRTCSAEEAPDRCQDRAPDLVLLVDGHAGEFKLLKQLKQAPLTSEIPLILALTHFDGSIAAQGLELGADEFLLSPFRADEVLARVGVVLKLRRDRRLLLASQEELTRLFQDQASPLFYCNRQGSQCHINPGLRRLLGYPGKRTQGVPMSAEELFFDAAEQERFQHLLDRPGAAPLVKVRLRHQRGHPVTVLLSDLAAADHAAERLGFQVHPVGAVSPLKEALRGLVEQFLPGARDYLALLHMTPLLGGRYKKEKKLGQGSFGEVWLVLDTEAEAPPRYHVAKIPFVKAANPKFRKEAEICRKLAPHPGAVRLIDIIEDDGKVVLIQEYIEGQTLDEFLGEDLPQTLVESIVIQLIDVVAHAHRQKIMHRDIKPNNIIIQPDGVLKLLDYGAAKILGEKDISATMVGSRPFMAPEQILGKSERRSDIWAIGVIMYLLYTGDLPFYSDVEKFLIDMILEREPLPPRQLNPDLPPPLEEIILKCLRKKPETRYPNALALKADLEQHLPGYGAGASP